MSEKGSAEEAIERDFSSIFQSIKESIDRIEETLEEDKNRLQNETKSAIEKLENNNLSKDRELEVVIRLMLDLTKGIEVISHLGFDVPEKERKHIEDLEKHAKNLMSNVSQDKKSKAERALSSINQRIEVATETSKKERLENFRLN